MKRRNYSLAVALILAFLLVAVKFEYQKRQSSLNVIAWDVYGYYLYLPSTVIYNDPGLQNKAWIESTSKKYPPSPHLYQFSPGIEGRQVNTYPMGLAVMYAPGFFMAHAFAKLSAFPADGFSAPYQWGLIFTAIFYACLGVFLLRVILLRFFSDKLTALLLFITVLGTNFLFHAGVDGTMPHNFMFVLNCLILICTIRWYETLRIRYAICLGIVLGLATISRPTELIWLLVPLLWGIHSRETFMARIKLLRSQYLHVWVLAGTLILTGLPQLLYWKWTTGHWFSFNHEEGFAFLDPYTFEFLFSYKKGWLLYTPVMVFALLGFYHLYRKRKDLFYPAFVFTVINIYVLSSWDCWWYAASFGQRPMVESYPLLAIPLGFFLVAVRGKVLHILTGFLVFACVVLNLFQSWQAAHWILDSSRMTKAYYWRIFGHTSILPGDAELLEIDRDQYSNGFRGKEDDYYKKEVYFRDFESVKPDIDEACRVDTFGFESRHCLRLDSLHDYAGSFEDNYWNLTSKDYCWLRMTVDVYPTVSPQIGSSCLVAVMEYRGQLRSFQALGVSDVPVKVGQWNTLHFDYLTPYILHKEDKLAFHFWNNGRKTVYIDNLKGVIWEPKH